MIEHYIIPKSSETYFFLNVLQCTKCPGKEACATCLPSVISQTVYKVHDHNDCSLFAIPHRTARHCVVYVILYTHAKTIHRT